MAYCTGFVYTSPRWEDFDELDDDCSCGHPGELHEDKAPFYCTVCREQ